jgi:hypothetical protein
MRQSRTFGTVGGEASNLLAYPAETVKTNFDLNRRARPPPYL